MRKNIGKSRVLIGVLLVLALLIVPVASVQAATSDTVTITATPIFISISIAPGTWTMGSVATSTDYWGNLSAIEPQWPLTSGECTWQISSTSSITYYTDVKGGNMTGGTQWDLGTVPASDVFTLIAGANGTANEAAMKVLSATYQSLEDAVHHDTTIDFEMRMETPTAFSDGTAKTGVVTILAASS